MLPCVTFSVMKNLLVSTFAKEDQSLGATRTDTVSRHRPAPMAVVHGRTCQQPTTPTKFNLKLTLVNAVCEQVETNFTPKGSTEQKVGMFGFDNDSTL